LTYTQTASNSTLINDVTMALYTRMVSALQRTDRVLHE